MPSHTKFQITIIVIGLLMLAVLLVVPANAWYGSYQYRQSHNVTGSSLWGVDQTNYPIKLAVFNTSGISSGETVYTNGTTANDWSDIRFTSMADTPYPYWIESTNATAAVVWVDLPSISATQNTQLYIYHGRSGDSSESNGKTTFLQLDDFPGSSVNSTLWNVSSGTVSVANSRVNITQASDTWNKLESFQTFGINTSIRAYGKIYTTAGTNNMMWGYSTAPGDIDRAYVHVGTSNNVQLITRKNGETSNSSADFWNPDTNFHIFEIMRNGGTNVTANIDATTITATNGISTASVSADFRTYETTTYETFDWILIRNYVFPEPVNDVWGGVEQDPNYTVPPASITGLTSTLTPYTITWNYTIPSDVDFLHTYIFKDGVFDQNVTTPTHGLTWSGLSPETTHIISIKTVDTNYNMNATWTNQSATTTNVTSNTDNGWITLINNTYLANSLSHNNTFIASGDLTHELTGETLTKASTNYNFTVTTGNYGELYLGQLYPAGHTKYRFNLSVIKGDAPNNNYIEIFGGRLFRVDVHTDIAGSNVYLMYYAANGTLMQDKTYTSTLGYTDFDIEYFPNGTTVLTNNKNTAQTFSTKFDLRQDYPYNYISSPTIQVYQVLNGGSYATTLLYNFEQKVPKSLITVWADNSKFSVGFDGVRSNYLTGTNWLTANGQRATLWLDPANYNLATDTIKNDISDMLNNKGYESGIHFTRSFDTISDEEVLLDFASNHSYISAQTGYPPLSWVSLGNDESSNDATTAWSSYNMLWRNAPQSGVGSYSSLGELVTPGGGSNNDNGKWWRVSSQYNTFNPVYVHSVMNTLTESDSIDTANFTTIMGNYLAGGVKIVPYAEWYYENMNTVQPITNVLFSSTNSHFNINTQGYNATASVYDPYPQGIWYADGGRVWTTIDNAATTNMTIRTPSDMTVQKLNATFTVSANSILVNVSSWNATYKKWNESSSNAATETTHIIGDLIPGNVISILKNHTAWSNATVNVTGYASFTYDEGYSDVQFEMQNEDATPIVADFTGTADGTTVTFTDLSTGTPTSWIWQYNQHEAPAWVQFSTDANPSYNFVEGTYDINLTATNAAGSDSEVKYGYIVVTASGAMLTENPQNVQSQKGAGYIIVALNLIGMGFVVGGGLLLVGMFMRKGVMGRGGSTTDSGLVGTMAVGILSILIGATFLLVTYAILGPLFNVVGV